MTNHERILKMKLYCALAEASGVHPDLVTIILLGLVARAQADHG